MKTVLAVLGTAIAVLAWVRPAHAANLTPAQITAALLTADDVGPGFTQNPDSAYKPDVGILRGFLRTTPTTDFLIVQIADAGLLTPNDVVSAISGALRGTAATNVRTGATFSPSGPGAGTVGQAVSATFSGRSLIGAAVSWRRDDALVGFLYMSSVSSTDAIARSIADLSTRQDDKLAGVQRGAASNPIGPNTVTSSLPAALPPALFVGVLTCESFASEEAAQALLNAYPDDPYGLDTDGNGIACEDLPHQTDADPVPVPRPASTTSRPAPVSAPTLDMAPAPLLDAGGSGDRQTDSFTTSGSRFQLCWDVSGRSPSGTFGPDVSFLVRRSGDQRLVTSFDVSQVGSNCTFVNAPAGTFYIETIATSWSTWHITVKPA
jgi:hypothetical protein